MSVWSILAAAKRSRFGHPEEPGERTWSLPCGDYLMVENWDHRTQWHINNTTCTSETARVVLQGLSMKENWRDHHERINDVVAHDVQRAHLRNELVEFFERQLDAAGYGHLEEAEHLAGNILDAFDVEMKS